jgi:hypothetical protein
MNHLHERTRAFLSTCQGKEGDEKKINYIQKTLWIGYPVIKDIESKMDEILKHPRIGRMPNLLILGRTNNGKSTLLRRFASRNLAVSVEESGSIRAEVIAIIMPEGPTEILFLDAILRATSISFKKTEPFRDKLNQVYNILENLESKVILIDEIHHIGAGAPKQQRLLMNLMKNLSTQFGLSFIAAGTGEARNIFSSDEQLSNRFRQVIIPVWEDNDDFKSLLFAFETLLPFEERSDLVGMSSYIINRTDATIGDIYDLLKSASIVAIKKGEKNITKKRLASCGHLSPAERANENKKTI